MEVDAAKLIGAGLCTIGVGGAGIGIGNITGKDLKNYNNI